MNMGILHQQSAIPPATGTDKMDVVENNISAKAKIKVIVLSQQNTA